MPTPYEQHVGGRNPVDVLRESYEEYRSILPKFTATQWSLPWQPGKWTAQQIMVHVMQWELIMSARLRLGVGQADYTVQPADQDDLMGTEDRVLDGPTAFAAFALMSVLAHGGASEVTDGLPRVAPDGGRECWQRSGGLCRFM